MSAKTTFEKKKDEESESEDEIFQQFRQFDVWLGTISTKSSSQPVPITNAADEAVHVPENEINENDRLDVNLHVKTLLNQKFLSENPQNKEAPEPAQFFQSCSTGNKHYTLSFQNKNQQDKTERQPSSSQNVSREPKNEPEKSNQTNQRITNAFQHVVTLQDSSYSPITKNKDAEVSIPNDGSSVSQEMECQSTSNRMQKQNIDPYGTPDPCPLTLIKQGQQKLLNDRKHQSSSSQEECTNIHSLKTPHKFQFTSIQNEPQLFSSLETECQSRKRELKNILHPLNSLENEHKYFSKERSIQSFSNCSEHQNTSNKYEQKLTNAPKILKTSPKLFRLTHSNQQPPHRIQSVLTQNDQNQFSHLNKNAKENENQAYSSKNSHLSSSEKDGKSHFQEKSNPFSSVKGATALNQREGQSSLSDAGGQPSVSEDHTFSSEKNQPSSSLKEYQKIRPFGTTNPYQSTSLSGNGPQALSIEGDLPPISPFLLSNQTIQPLKISKKYEHNTNSNNSEDLSSSSKKEGQAWTCQRENLLASSKKEGHSCMDEKESQPSLGKKFHTFSIQIDDQSSSIQTEGQSSPNQVGQPSSSQKEYQKIRPFGTPNPNELASVQRHNHQVLSTESDQPPDQPPLSNQIFQPLEVTFQNHSISNQNLHHTYSPKIISQSSLSKGEFQNISPLLFDNANKYQPTAYETSSSQNDFHASSNCVQRAVQLLLQRQLLKIVATTHRSLSCGTKRKEISNFNEGRDEDSVSNNMDDSISPSCTSNKNEIVQNDSIDDLLTTPVVPISETISNERNVNSLPNLRRHKNTSNKCEQPFSINAQVTARSVKPTLLTSNEDPFLNYQSVTTQNKHKTVSKKKEQPCSTPKVSQIYSSEIEGNRIVSQRGNATPNRKEGQVSLNRKGEEGLSTKKENKKLQHFRRIRPFQSASLQKNNNQELLTEKKDDPYACQKQAQNIQPSKTSNKHRLMSKRNEHRTNSQSSFREKDMQLEETTDKETSDTLLSEKNGHSFSNNHEMKTSPESKQPSTSGPTLEPLHDESPSSNNIDSHISSTESREIWEIYQSLSKQTEYPALDSEKYNLIASDHNKNKSTRTFISPNEIRSAQNTDSSTLTEKKCQLSSSQEGNPTNQDFRIPSMQSAFSQLPNKMVHQTSSHQDEQENNSFQFGLSFSDIPRLTDPPSVNSKESFSKEDRSVSVQNEYPAPSKKRKVHPFLSKQKQHDIQQPVKRPYQSVSTQCEQQQLSIDMKHQSSHSQKNFQDSPPSLLEIPKNYHSASTQTSLSERELYQPPNLEGRELQPNKKNTEGFLKHGTKRKLSHVCNEDKVVETVSSIPLDASTRSFSNCASPTTETSQKDPLDHFARYIVSLMRILPLRKAIKVQGKLICCIINEMSSSDDESFD